MVKAALTGSKGFLGWHTRAALRESGVDIARVNVGETFDESDASAAVNGATRVIHLAGVNRGNDGEVRDGNLLFARQLAMAIRRAESAPELVVYANSTQVGNNSVYGVAKEEAANLLAQAAAEVGAEYRDVLLPNLFGEHGRPFYNSVTATFCHVLSEGARPEIESDKELTLLHAQNAADVLIGNRAVGELAQLAVNETVSGLLDRLEGFARTYQRGDFPDVANDFDRDLFNTYRSFTFPARAPVRLRRHADQRGSFFEIIRSHGGSGQSSFSTTVPGVTRGDHFHRRKIERFTVLSGSATISLRRLFSDEVVSFKVRGDQPTAVDMPTMWAHNITNTGDDVLYTSFWTNDIFDPESSDTIAEVV